MHTHTHSVAETHEQTGVTRPPPQKLVIRNLPQNELIYSYLFQVFGMVEFSQIFHTLGDITTGFQVCKTASADETRRLEEKTLQQNRQACQIQIFQL